MFYIYYLLNESLNRIGQQFHQYQQKTNNQTIEHTKKTKTYDTGNS